MMMIWWRAVCDTNPTCTVYGSFTIYLTEALTTVLYTSCFSILIIF